MKTYISVGIGDMMCLDSILTKEEKEEITEVFWACRFGHCLVPLMKNNPHYPNLRKQYTIPDHIGKRAMSVLEPGHESFWHFRPDFFRSYEMGKRLFSIESEEISPIDAVSLIKDSNRNYLGSSFLDNADCLEAHKEYILFHYPTSTRPRTDIASITPADWAFVDSLSKQEKLKVVVLADHEIIVPLANYELLINPDMSGVMSLIKSCRYYAGCDSFCAILAAKVLEKENLFVKSHNQNIQMEVLTNTWLQRFFLPHSPEDLSSFYKNYIGRP